jgi:hypothetical protein
MTGPMSGKAAACSAATCAAHRPTHQSVPLGTRGTKRRKKRREGSTLEAADAGVRGDEQGEVGAEIGVKEEGDGGGSAFAVCHSRPRRRGGGHSEQADANTNEAKAGAREAGRPETVRVSWSFMVRFRASIFLRNNWIYTIKRFKL